MSRDPHTPVVLLFWRFSRDVGTSPSLFPKCTVDEESKNKLECQNTAFSCRFGASTALSRFWALSQPGQTSVCCCEKSHINGLGLHHLVYLLFSM